MHKIILSLFASFCFFQAVYGADPTATNYTFSECEGSLMPYPSDINPAVYPDSLTPVFINYVGRHGARFPASPSNCVALQTALEKADSLGTITPTGRRLKKLNEEVMLISKGRWGALDSLGLAEMRSIATRMFYNFGEIFKKDISISAYSSFSPRAMMSMYEFLHQLDRLNNHIDFFTTTGRLNDKTIRPFDVDREYLEFRKEQLWELPYLDYFDKFCPTTAIRKALGERFPFQDEDEARSLAMAQYYVVAGCSAMGIDIEASTYFTREEYNRLWSCFNLRQYLQRSASTISTVPADIAGYLLQDLITTTEDFIAGENESCAVLRFGHAETLIPLLSLLRLKGCYYMTNYFDTVGLHWKDFQIVPMAANLQMILFKSNKGKYYLRVDLNEKPTSLIPNDPRIYLPWDEARAFLSAVLPPFID